MTYIDTVRVYFDAWLTKKPDLLPNIFSDDIVYSECYGPEYRGLKQNLPLVCRLECAGNRPEMGYQKCIAKRRFSVCRVVF